MQTKTIFSFIVLFISVSVYAQESNYTVNSGRIMEKDNSFTLAVVPDKASPSFGLYVYNPEKKRIELEISHPVNGVVVDTSFNAGQFNRRYNFGQADDGRYIVSLICGKEKITKIVGVNTVTTRNIVIE